MTQQPEFAFEYNSMEDGLYNEDLVRSSSEDMGDIRTEPFSLDKIFDRMNEIFNKMGGDIFKRTIGNTGWIEDMRRGMEEFHKTMEDVWKGAPSYTDVWEKDYRDILPQEMKDEIEASVKDGSFSSSGYIGRVDSGGRIVIKGYVEKTGPDGQSVIRRFESPIQKHTEPVGIRPPESYVKPELKPEDLTPAVVQPEPELGSNKNKTPQPQPDGGGEEASKYDDDVNLRFFSDSDLNISKDKLEYLEKQAKRVYRKVRENFDRKPTYKETINLVISRYLEPGAKGATPIIDPDVIILNTANIYNEYDLIRTLGSEFSHRENLYKGLDPEQYKKAIRQAFGELEDDKNQFHGVDPEAHAVGRKIADELVGPSAGLFMYA